MVVCTDERVPPPGWKVIAPMISKPGPSVLHTADQPRRAAPQGASVSARLAREALAAKFGFALLLVYLVHTLVGVAPLAVPEPGIELGTSALDIVIVAAMFLLGIVILALVRERAADLGRQSALLLTLVLLAAATALLAEHPGVGLRRAARLVMSTTIAFSIAASLRREADFLLAIIPAFIIVMACNIVALFVLPEVAISPLGVRGIFSSKNVAGAAASVGVLIAYAALLSRPRWPLILASALMMILSGTFLFMTGSKTAVGLCVVIVIGASAFLMTARRSFVGALLFMLGLFWLASSFSLLVAVQGWGLPEILEVVVGDPTFSKRTDIWAFAIEEIWQRPWLGSGYGSFWSLGPVNDPLARAPAGSWLREVRYGIINQAHNGFLDLALQVGVPLTVFATLVTFRALVNAAYLAIAAPAGTLTAALFKGSFLFMLFFISHNFMEASLFIRGQLIFSLALPIFFIIERGMMGLVSMPKTGNGRQPLNRHRFRLTGDTTASGRPLRGIVENSVRRA